MGIGTAISVRNGSVAPSDLDYPLLRIIFEFTIKDMTTKCGVLDGELSYCGPGIYTTGIDRHPTAFAHIPSPTFI